jgi:endonuclease/exonuclease/phosphatase family metal-dependent hydrolase
MRKVTILLSTLFIVISTPSADAADANLKVISRNIYVGSDVGVAMKLIPDFKAAAQFMWDQVAATDFSKRAPLLAKEIITNKADVVGIQEATTWFCKKNAWSGKTEVLNFTDQLLAATKNLGSEYVLAEKDGTKAKNIGFSIAAIPFLTIVNDPKTFQPLFGQDTAACGFEIGDALIIRKDLARNISKVGNTEYEASYSVVPTIMTIYRGYTWMDLKVGSSTVRIVSTHLESVWDANKVPNAAKQAKQLVTDLSNTTIPTIVIGDFNADPRDPRKDPKNNPGGQPEASDTCPVQVDNPTAKSSLVPLQESSPWSRPRCESCFLIGLFCGLPKRRPKVEPTGYLRSLGFRRFPEGLNGPLQPMKSE